MSSKHGLGSGSDIWRKACTGITASFGDAWPGEGTKYGVRMKIYILSRCENTSATKEISSHLSHILQLNDLESK